LYRNSWEKFGGLKMSGKYGLKPDEAKIIEELETIADKEIPKIDNIDPNYNPFAHGVVVEGDTVVGLALFDCKLKTLPESISQLTSLKTLFIKTNKLKTLPESLMALKSLEKLYVIENELEKLPESIGQLETLQVLSLGVNKLEKLPESIG